MNNSNWYETLIEAIYHTSNWSVIVGFDDEYEPQTQTFYRIVDDEFIPAVRVDLVPERTFTLLDKNISSWVKMENDTGVSYEIRERA